MFATAWALVDDAVPIYPLYALLFAANGLTDAQISALFVVWSVVGLLGQVPAGALADRISRRAVLAAAGVVQAAGYLLWTVWPGFTGFALGFVGWGLAGALSGGTMEALLYDGLSAVDAERHYSRVRGLVTAAGLLAQLPAALGATVLFSVGGYRLVGWASVGCCLLAALLASRLPVRAGADDDDDGPGYLATLRAGLAEAVGNPAVRGATLALALVFALDAFEEYFGLLAHEWGVPTRWVPLATLGIPLVGAIGAAGGAVAGRLRGGQLGGLLLGATLVLGVAVLVRQPIGLAGIALFYFPYRLVLVGLDAQLQRRISGPARATVTSVAELATDCSCLLVFAAWAIGRAPLVAGLGVAIALAVPWLLRIGRIPR